MGTKTQTRWLQASVVTPLLVGLAVVSVWTIWREIASRALHNPEDSHILMAVPVAFWLAWLRRSRLRKWKPSPSMAGPVLVVIGVVLVWIGYRAAIDVAQHLGVLLILLGAVASVLGHRLLLMFKPSLIALLFLFPVPGRIRQHIAIPLEQVSALVTENLLSLFGVGIERTGNLLVINEHQVAVAEACNGMRMVSALGLITFAFVFSVPMRPKVRLLLLVLSPLVALLVNIIRLIPTTLAYGYASTDTAEFVHDAGGWVVLGLAIGLLWLCLVTLRWLEIPIDPYPVPKVPV